MEDSTRKKENESQNPLKKWVIILAVLAGFFLITTIYFAFIAKPVLNTEYKKTELERVELQAELNALLIEHDKIKAEYGDLSVQLSEKDSVIMANAEEIKRLINSQADYNKIRKQMARLQNIAKEYVEEMDKLYQENKALKEENTLVKESLAQEKERTVAIQRDNESLSEKITTAAVLQAYNIYSRALNVKTRNETETVTEKASRAKRFKISFILGENPLVEPGPINLYCRIAIPETGRVLSMGNSDGYSFTVDGQKMQYTAKTTINYTNKAENVSLYWDIRPDDKPIKGTYLVQIYTDDHLLGESSFTLQ